MTLLTFIVALIGALLMLGAALAWAAAVQRLRPTGLLPMATHYLTTWIMGLAVTVLGVTGLAQQLLPSLANTIFGR